MSNPRIPPHARAFVNAFLSAGAPRAQALVAAPGTGGGGTLLEVVTRCIRPHGRALIVVPFVALAHQFARRVEENVPELAVHIVDTPGFRESVAASAENPFAKPGVYVVLANLALGPAFDAVLSLAWDIVAVDGAAHIGLARAHGLDRVIASPLVSRILVLFDAHERVVGLAGTRLAELPIAQWDPQLLRDETGRPLLRDVQSQVVRFERGAAESRLLLSVLTMLGGGLRGTPLLRAALSCNAALEATLVAVRNRMVHGVSALGEESLEVTSEPSAISLMSVPGILEQIDSLTQDSKLDAFMSAVGPPETVGRIVVFTVFVATSQYVQAALQERGHIVQRLSGDLTAEERDDGMHEFTTYGGVLVVTAGILSGVSLPNVDRVIHYDLPATNAEYRTRNARLRRGPELGPLVSLLLVDTSDAARTIQANVSELVSGEDLVSP